MKILAKLLGVGLLLIVVVNLYRYFIMSGGTQFTDNFHFVGFKDFFKHLSTFNGWSNFSSTLSRMSAIVNKLNNEDYNFWTGFLDGLAYVGNMLSLPFMIIADIVMNVIWFFELLTGIGWTINNA